jgi:hypothetical protein
VIVYFGQFFENNLSGQNFMVTIFHRKSSVLPNFDKKYGLGYIFGQFYVHSHPSFSSLFFCLCTKVLISI